MQLSSGVHVSGQGPAVVFLHSSLSSSRQWFPLVQSLNQNFTCINIDLLGYGLADNVTEQDKENYSFDVEVKRIIANVSSIIGDRPFHLVGHSCGGAIALKMAVEAPQKLISMTLFEPVAFHLLPIDSQERRTSDDFARYVDIDDNYKAAEIFTNFWNSEGFFNALPNKMKALMAKDMPKVRLDFRGIMAESYTLDDVEKVLVPCLLKVGEDSPELSKYLAEKIVSSLPNGELKLTSGGHMAPISHAEEVLANKAEFILAQQTLFTASL